MENSAKVREYLRECGVFYIATEDARQPRVRPFEWHLPLRRKTLHLHTEGFTIVQTAESRSADGNLCDASGQILDFRHRKAQ